MLRNSIPTAQHHTFTNYTEVEKYLKSNPKRVVLKKSGLAAGKGVLESEDLSTQLEFAHKTLQEDQLVIEEYLEGVEASVFMLLDGSTFLILPPCMDYKKAYDGNTGPNTGGMGSICPVPQISSSVLEQITQKVVIPTFKGLEKEGLLYQGVLYLGLMITQEGPKVLEFNVRLGDPETQALVPVLKNDMGNLAEAITTGGLNQFPFFPPDKACVGVVVAAPGYPGEYKKHLIVDLKQGQGNGSALIFHASTYRDASGTLKTQGGRCFTVVGIGNNIFEAASKAYAQISNVRFEGAWYRKDIGKLLPDVPECKE